MAMSRILSRPTVSPIIMVWLEPVDDPVPVRTPMPTSERPPVDIPVVG